MSMLGISFYLPVPAIDIVLHAYAMVHGGLGQYENIILDLASWYGALRQVV